MKKKTVYFDKYIPYTLVESEDGTTKETILNLEPLFEDISQGEDNKPKAELKEIFGEKYRFHVCQRVTGSNSIWEIQILHLRDSVLPGVADEAGEYEQLTLPDGKYPAESCTILYDSQRNVLCLQRNIFCISVTKLRFYLKEMLPESTRFILKPVIHGNQIDCISESIGYRKITLAYDSDQATELNDDDNSSLASLIKGYGRYQGRLITISIGMGRKKGRLNSKEASKLIREAYDTNGIQSLKADVALSPDAGYDWLDLLEDRDSISCPMKSSKDDPLTHTSLFNACFTAYTK